MSEERKTISIDPALLGHGKGSTKTKGMLTRKRREKPASNVNASTLRRALIERIKMKRAEERKLEHKADALKDSLGLEKRPSGLQAEQKESVEKRDEAKSEYQSSMDFLDTLAKKRAEERKQRKRQPRKPRVPRPEIAVNTQLPSSLHTQLPTSSRTFKRYSVSTSPGPAARQPTNVPIVPTPPPPGPSLPVAMPAPPHIATVNTATAPKPPPYGNLKSGLKPTYRSYYNRTLKNTGFAIRNQTPQEADKMRASVEAAVKSEVEKGLPQVGKPRRHIKRKMRNTKVRTFKLGKANGRVGVLLKNNTTRRKVAQELTQLRRKKIGEIRQFLRDRDLIRAGTTAPNEVLRTIYEQSILTGNVSNRNRDNLIHNYMAKDEI